MKLSVKIQHVIDYAYKVDFFKKPYYKVRIDSMFDVNSKMYFQCKLIGLLSSQEEISFISAFGDSPYASVVALHKLMKYEFGQIQKITHNHA